MMAIAMWFIVVGLALLTVAATWLFGPYGLAGGGLVVLIIGYELAKPDGAT